MNSEMLDRIQLKLENIITQSPYPEDVFHSINTLEWTVKLFPAADSDLALQIAALGHDIERGFEERCIRASHYDTFDEYKQAHALNCAEILVEILEEYDMNQDIIDDVAHLVANHEVGGDEREELLKNADTLSFFHVSLPLYYDRRGAEITKKRCVWGFKKLPPDLKEIVKEIDYPDEDLKKLILESVGE